MNFTQAEATLRQLQKELSYYNNIRRTLEWDMRVNLPAGGVTYRSGCIGFMADQAHRLTTAPEMEEAASAVLASGRGDSVLRAVAAQALAEARKYAAIPRRLYSDYAAHCLKAEAVWREAKAKNDFSLFCDDLETAFALKRQFAAAAGREREVVTYLLDEREPGMTEARMDALLEELKEFLIPFVRQIGAQQAEQVPLDGCYQVEDQRRLCLEVMKAFGFDFEAGRLDESAHPVTTPNQRGDIRITTRFAEHSFLPGLISCCHETGHGLYHQNIAPELSGTALNFSSSPGMDEGVARFWENMIGRSRSFWQWLFPLARKRFPALERFSPEDLYRAVNTVHISAERRQTDELTGNLHIILRYEVEKLLLRGEITAADVPAVWNEKSKLYFGAPPRRDAEGCLADMHWAGGFIAYFQSYVLANFYDGHFLKQLREESIDLDSLTAQGNFAPLAQWQTDRIFRYGALHSSEELLREATGEILSPKPYMEYLRAKYSELYSA